MHQDQLDSKRSPDRPGSRTDTDKRQTQQIDLLQLERQHQLSRQQAFRFIITQLLTTIVLSGTLLFFDRIVAYSSFIGGLIATLANAWFAIKVFRIKPTVAAETLLTTFYVGEIYRFVLTGALFMMAFVLIKPLSAVALLLTYLLIHITPAVHNVLLKDSTE